MTPLMLAFLLVGVLGVGLWAVTGGREALDDLVELLARAAERLEMEVAIARRMGARGQTNLVGLILGVLIAGIVAISVFIPVINDQIANSNVTGTTKTILDLLPLFAALLVMIALASPLMNRL